MANRTVCQFVAALILLKPSLSLAPPKHELVKSPFNPNAYVLHLGVSGDRFFMVEKVDGKGWTLRTGVYKGESISKDNVQSFDVGPDASLSATAYFNTQIGALRIGRRSMFEGGSADQMVWLYEGTKQLELERVDQPRKIAETLLPFYPPKTQEKLANKRRYVPFAFLPNCPSLFRRFLVK